MSNFLAKDLTQTDKAPSKLLKREPSGILLEPTPECVAKIKQLTEQKNVSYYGDKDNGYMKIPRANVMEGAYYAKHYPLGTYLVDGQFCVSKKLFEYLTRICKQPRLFFISAKDSILCETCIVDYNLGKTLDDSTRVTTGYVGPIGFVFVYGSLCYDDLTGCVAKIKTLEGWLFDDVDHAIKHVKRIGLDKYVPMLEEFYE